MERFKEQLRRQVKFLLNSCKIFDNGDWEEAIRIATSIRILIHDTPKSTSLLKHLNAKQINLISNSPQFKDSNTGYQCITAFNLGVIVLSTDKVGYMPNLGGFKPGLSTVLPIDQWWEQIVWILSPECKLSRKNIILSAVNQDGGAHIDGKLNQNYENLTLYCAGTLTGTVGSRVYSKEITDLHLISIRTIANELLKSPEFLYLLK